MPHRRNGLPRLRRQDRECGGREPGGAETRFGFASEACLLSFTQFVSGTLYGAKAYRDIPVHSTFLRYVGIVC